MPLIADPNKYPSKKKFKEAVKEDPSKVFLNDPSIVGNSTGYVSEIIKHKNPFTVTNHPKRTWFAEVKISERGKYKGQIVVK
jgi:hypothetical protein